MHKSRKLLAVLLVFAAMAAFAATASAKARTGDMVYGPESVHQAD